jgi:hypothetical protein
MLKTRPLESITLVLLLTTSRVAILEIARIRAGTGKFILRMLVDPLSMRRPLSLECIEIIARRLPVPSQPWRKLCVARHDPRLRKFYRSPILDESAGKEAKFLYK